MKIRTVVATTALVVALAGCGESGGDGGSSPVDKANEKAQREYDACVKQADEIANTQGADAGGAHLDECVDNFANETLVE